MRVTIPVSAGELIDRITILRIKAERIPVPAKAASVRKELEQLNGIRRCFPGLAHRGVRPLERALKKTNRILWEAEDQLRALERSEKFGRAFVALARRVYITNDERARLKHEIDACVGSEVLEQKWFSAKTARRK